MRTLQLLATVLVLGLAGTSQAAVKFYDSSQDYGTPGVGFLTSTNLCPPVTTFLGRGEGSFAKLLDDNLGTVTLSEITLGAVDTSDFDLEAFFGPGAFIFTDTKQFLSITSPEVSLTTGVGAHGPSGTDPGESTEWGIVTGWEITGFTFCVASPVTLCNNNGLAHGQTVLASLASDTFNLGTWNFDASGDYEAAEIYIRRTSNGGLSNNSTLLQGAFHGASLPALPLLGFAALAVSLAVIGARALLGKK